jgi:hypothetical protein
MDLADGDVAPTNQQTTNQQAPQAPQPLGAQGRPGFFRSLLASLLTGVQAGAMAPQNAQGPSEAAQIAQALPQQRIQQQRQAQQFQTQQDTEKARLALTQIQIQQAQLLLKSSSDDVANKFEDSGRTMVSKALENGTGKVLFEGDRETAHNKQLELMKQNGNLSIMTLPSPSSKGQYAVVEFQPKGTIQESYKVTLPGDKDLGVEDDSVDIPEGMSQSSANALLAQKARDHAAKINAAGKVKAAQTSSDAAMARTKLSINAANWRAELHESNANARARMAAANKSTDTQYINLIKQYNQKVAQADKWAQDNKVSAAIGWKDNPYSQEVDAYANIVSQYEQSHPNVVGGMKGASPTAAKTGAKVRVKLSDGRTGSVDEKEFDEKTMSKVQ